MRFTSYLARRLWLPAICCFALGGQLLAQQPYGSYPAAAPAAPGDSAFAPPAAEPPISTPPLTTPVVAAPSPAPAGQAAPYPYPPPGQAVPYPYPPPGPGYYPYPYPYVQPAPPTLLVPTRPTRFWFRSDLLLWGAKAAPLPAPLVTVGSAADPVPGALGQPGTQVIAGSQNVHWGVFGGTRFEAGLWLGDQQAYSIEAGYFVLGRRETNFSDFSDDFGNPVIARPTISAITGHEGAYADSFPGLFTGGVTITNSSQFQGWDLDGTLNLVRGQQFRWDGVLGFRYLNLTETLEIDDQLAELVPGTLTFLGNNIHFADTLADYDNFHTTNNFYGGQLGTRLIWVRGRWSIGGVGKIALGTNQQRTVINGQTALFTPSGAASIAEGGVLATSANIGNYYRSVFSVTPEVNLNVGFLLTPRIMFRVGYTFIYWSNVLRPGNQVNRLVSPNLVPTDVAYGQPGPNQPGNQFHASGYWAQGVNLGFQFNF